MFSVTMYFSGVPRPTLFNPLFRQMHTPILTDSLQLDLGRISLRRQPKCWMVIPQVIRIHLI
jgi:hypothetical protein